MESLPFFPSPRSHRRRLKSEPEQHWHMTAVTGWPEPAQLLASRYPTPALHTMGLMPLLRAGRSQRSCWPGGAGDRRI